MRSLFVKIFLSFWLTVILTGAIVHLISYLNRPEERPILENQLQFASKGLDGYAREAAEALARGGDDGWRQYLEGLDPESPRPFLFTAKGATLSGQRAPKRAARLAEMVFSEGSVKAMRAFPFFYFGRPLPLPDQTPAVLVVELKVSSGGSGRLRRTPRRRDFLPGQEVGLAALLVVGGIVCFGLTRSLTRPIRKLSEATRQVADGDLSTRVSQDIKAKNEIGRLARDFDRMAERIEDLVDSQKRLQRDISHELRSPLARLNIALELARQRSGGDAKTALDRIERETGRMNEMIGQLLSLNLLETGSRQVPQQMVDLSALVRDIVADAEFEARNRNRAVHLNQNDDILIQGSEDLLRRIVENVIRNGLNYTTEGTAVEVDLEHNEASGQVTIRVRDHGPGVPDEELQKIFEPFYRTAVARDRTSGGTGIGLAIVERATRRHGGTVEARNARNGGLIVEIRLPG